MAGLFGGIDVGLGIVAMILVIHAAGSKILADMVFGMGLLALMLALFELFTEENPLPLIASRVRPSGSKSCGYGRSF